MYSSVIHAYGLQGGIKRAKDRGDLRSEVFLIIHMATYLWQVVLVVLFDTLFSYSHETFMLYETLVFTVTLRPACGK
jgi:hypothetical protein